MPLDKSHFQILGICAKEPIPKKFSSCRHKLQARQQQNECFVGNSKFGRISSIWFEKVSLPKKKQEKVLKNKHFKNHHVRL